MEDIRSIREEVNFLPTKAKYRVYIIDEVHMLSTGAFNALLKTLEEPPEHVKFMLATTEPQKLPATILSRCQRFDYKKISNENVVKRLKIICAESDISITDEALHILAVLSEGAMRDAISILERCSQESADEITADLVKELVGIPSLEMISKLTKAILENDETTALQAIDEVLEDGKDLYNFLWEVIKYVKDILVYKATKKLELYSQEELMKIKDLADKAEKERFLEIIYQLSELENSLKSSTQKTIMFQAGILRICMKKIQKPILQSEVDIMQQQVAKRQPEVAQNQVKQQSKPVTQNVKPTQDWQEIVNQLKNAGKIRLYTCLVNTAVDKLNDQTWEIIFSNGLTDFNKRILEEPNNRADLIKAIAMATGTEINIKLRDGKAKTVEKKTDTSAFDGLGIDVNVIE